MLYKENNLCTLIKIHITYLKLHTKFNSSVSSFDYLNQHL